MGRLFSVPKKDSGKGRVILNISNLNKSIYCWKFKMTLVSQVRRILPQAYWAVSIDLKVAYWHVPIENAFKKFLGFLIEGKKFQF